VSLLVVSSLCTTIVTAIRDKTESFQGSPAPYRHCTAVRDAIDVSALPDGGVV
jgi:hypothetical protein